MLRKARIISQAFVLSLFIFLFIQTESKGHDELGYPVKIFLDFDPLIFLSTVLSSMSLETAFLLSLITVFLTITFGRVFCGWLCPFGALNNLVSLFNKKTKRPINWHPLKYYILLFLIVLSVFSIQFTGIFDPISLLIRSLSVGIYPALNEAINSILELIYKTEKGFLMEFSITLDRLLKKTILSFYQPYFVQGVFISSLFITLLLLNLYEKRFWCRYLCPLGALLGLLSRYSIISRSVSEGCISCGKCEKSCPAGAYPGGEQTWLKQECYYCWNCDDLCPVDAVNFKPSLSKINTINATDISRRRIAITFASSLISIPILNTSPVYKKDYFNPHLIRPPGARNEKDFLDRCVKCGECMKVCITNGLQPTLLEAGIEGIWTPMLVPKLGYCEYRCTLCGQVCPTSAIKRLTLKEKEKTIIGLAMIDKGRCLPYAFDKPCIVCEEVCPTPKKAIFFKELKVKDKDGREIILQQPYVDTELCVGCGICEAKCPVVDKPAIYVTSIGESRSKDNQLHML
ncbi:MAG TPA: 4Fe-4S binding protein [Nitrospirae bacterium]|nr:4Fe-4S binding protein [Nitrospirota bacterium]